MLTATLYLPQQLPRTVSADGLSLPTEAANYFAQVPSPVPALLDCERNLVDVLASGPHYVAYSVFDFEGLANLAAMEALTALSGTTFSLDDEDTVLCGPVLIVRQA